LPGPNQFTDETVVQIHGNVPFALTYVNPEDDPSKSFAKQ
jgi:hypothetical protein